MNTIAAVRRRNEIFVVVVAGLAGAVVAWLFAPDSGAGALIGLGVALVVGGCLELHTEGGRGLLLSNAFMLVVAASYGVEQAALTMFVALLLSAWLRPNSGLADQLGRLGEQYLVATATLVAYDVVYELSSDESLGSVVLALLVAVVAQVAADELMRWLLGWHSGLGERGRLAWLAVGSSGMLMAIGYRGVGGDGEFGLWGVLLFSVPLLATWFAFERFDSAQQTHLQTIDALSMAPELGGLVLSGHAERVASLADEIAVDLALDEGERQNLETAAKLHHLGVVTLDDPESPSVHHSPQLVAEVTAGMLGEIPRLEPAARIVAGEQVPNRPARGSKSPTLESRILKVASAYDDLTEGDEARAGAALEVLFSGPGYVYDSTVLTSLERVLELRGQLDAATAN